MVADFKHKKIRSVKTVGEKLRLARKRFGYSLEFVEKETRISLKYLKLIENNDYRKLPADVYIIGFLDRYCSLLNLNSKETIEQYKEDKKIMSNLGFFNKFKKDSEIKINPSDKWLKNPSFIITPKLIISAMVIILVTSVLSYIFYQVKGFAAAPSLSLSELGSEQIVQVESITLTGQTDPGANILINNQMVAIDQNGFFVQEIKLNSGVNNIEITAKNKADKETIKTIKVLAEY